LYRRRGPDGPSSLQAVLDGASRVVNRRLRSNRVPAVVAAAAVPVLVAVQRAEPLAAPFVPAVARAVE